MPISTDRYQEAIRLVEKNGHVLTDDPPSIPSTVSRQTCSKCGSAVLGNSRNAYGSAITIKCPQQIKADT